MGHHYVPRFYLKNFAFNADKPRNEPQVFSMTKKGMIPDKPNTVRSICQQKNYNSPEQEREQKQLEDRYAVILRDFIETTNQEECVFSAEFIEFVSFMMSNNANTRKKYTGVIRDELRKNHNMRVDGEYKKKLDFSLSLSRCVFDTLKTWEFLEVKETNNKNIFITSDNPVSLFHPIDGGIPVTGSLVGKYGDIENVGGRGFVKMSMASVSFGVDAAIIFPITPNICVIGFSEPGNLESYIHHHKNDFFFYINLITLCNCNKAVYSYSKELLELTGRYTLQKLESEKGGYSPAVDRG